MAYQGDTLLGVIGADNSARAISKAAREFNVLAKVVRVVSLKSGKEPAPKAKGEALTASEASSLAMHEATIERGLQTFIEVGTALFAIRDGNLFRSTHESFESYCRDRWGWSSRHVNQQIAAAQIAGHLVSGGAPPVTSIRQATPLTRLEPDQQAEVWQEAVETAPNGQPSGDHVAATADRLYPRGQTLINGVPGSDKAVDRMRERGVIPEGVTVEVTDPGEDATRPEEIAEEHAEREAIREAEQSDDDWLDALPIVHDQKLSGAMLACFRKDALIFRGLESWAAEGRRLLKSLRRIHGQRSRLEGMHEGFMGYALSRQHPRDWKVCPPTDKGGCGGNGSLLTGQCGKCRGRGYIGQ